MQSTQEIQSTATQTTSPVDSSPEQPTKHYGRNWKKWILIYLLIGAVIYAGVYYFVLSKQNSKPYSAPVGKVKPSPAPTVAYESTANWQTNSNNQIGYSFKYPAGWSVQNPGENWYYPTMIVDFIPEGRLNTMGTTYCDGVKDSKRCESYKTSDNATAQIDWPGGEYSISKVFVQISRPKGGVVTMELSNAGAKVKFTLRQILKTFKFTDQNYKANGLTDYTSKKGKFSLSYPSYWVQPDHKEFCNTDLFDRAIYLGPDKDSVLHCASSYGGQIYVYSQEGDKRTDHNLDKGFTNIQSSAATVSGITGQRLEGTASDQSAEGAPLQGTKIVEYLFYTNNITYSAYYYLAPKGYNPSRDVLNEFEKMVKTIEFISP